eukprot:CAMPEP_0197523598 /NCGR_PEP_ID=MMETSP1318-20131121/8503_1 /TAXON_ID=552666 /ORGANISM="Partenskyella glossopodia, Strain RCC365" /LENGTH=58 /DNA_ID=CAMNT_0043076341 /DNA_START=891 /DNA_END=1067 /DNA_ORIENTATION=-
MAAERQLADVLAYAQTAATSAITWVPVVGEYVLPLLTKLQHHKIRAHCPYCLLNSILA